MCLTWEKYWLKERDEEFVMIFLGCLHGSILMGPDRVGGDLLYRGIYNRNEVPSTGQTLLKLSSNRRSAINPEQSSSLPRITIPEGHSSFMYDWSVTPISIFSQLCYKSTPSHLRLNCSFCALCSSCYLNVSPKSHLVEIFSLQVLNAVLNMVVHVFGAAWF
jgi:hypothetical protein